MRLPTLLAALGLVALAAVGNSQPPPPAPLPEPSQYVPPGLPPSTPTPVLPLTPSAEPVPGVYQPIPAPAVPGKAPEQTLEQLMDTLEKIQAQKAALEKQEQAVKDLLVKKAAAHAERMKKLGVVKEQPKAEALADPLRTSSEETRSFNRK